MKINLLIAISLLLFSNFSHAQTNDNEYPDYDVIVEQFFKNYSVNDLSAQVNLHKKPDGWHIVLIDYTKGKKDIVKDELFWSSKNNTFQNLSFETTTNKTQNNTQIEQFKNSWDRRLYKISPYYGYIGWDKDVIDVYKNAQNLSDTTLYGLGRAYSSYSSNLLNNNTGFADSAKMFKIPDGKNCLSEKQLTEYRFYRHKAIEKFEELNKQNPEFETIVGKITIKTANEYLTSYLDLHVYQNKLEAQKELKSEIYPRLLISTAKNYLNSCASNTILFTNGDNDTYPLIYVQAQLGFRTDITVVNISLLSTQRYAEHLKNKVFDGNGLPITYTLEQLKSKHTEFVLCSYDEDNPTSLAELIEITKNEENLKSNSAGKYFQTNRFLSFNEGSNLMSWKRRNSYLLRAELLLYDILVHNNWKRPVYFSFSFDKRTYEGLLKYMQLEGFAYRLTSTEKEKNIENIGFIDSDLMYDNMMNKFDWLGVEHSKSKNVMFLNHYRLIASELTNILIKENKNEQAEKVVDNCIKVISNKRLHYDYYVLPFVKAYWMLKKDKKANKIAQQLIYNCNNRINNRPGEEHKRLDQISNYTKQELLKMAKVFNQQEIIDKLSN